MYGTYLRVRQAHLPQQQGPGAISAKRLDQTLRHVGSKRTSVQELTQTVIKRPPKMRSKTWSNMGAPPPASLCPLLGTASLHSPRGIRARAPTPPPCENRSQSSRKAHEKHAKKAKDDEPKLELRIQRCGLPLRHLAGAVLSRPSRSGRADLAHTLRPCAVQHHGHTRHAPSRAVRRVRQTAGPMHHLWLVPKLPGSQHRQSNRALRPAEHCCFPQSSEVCRDKCCEGRLLAQPGGSVVTSNLSVREGLGATSSSAWLVYLQPSRVSGADVWSERVDDEPER